MRVFCLVFFLSLKTIFFFEFLTSNKCNRRVRIYFYLTQEIKNFSFPPTIYFNAVPIL